MIDIAGSSPSLVRKYNHIGDSMPAKREADSSPSASPFSTKDSYDEFGLNARPLDGVRHNEQLTRLTEAIIRDLLAPFLLFANWKG